MENTKFNIKKGSQYLCKKDFRECGDIRILYVQGRTYLSEVDGCITDELGEKDLEWDKYSVSEYFEEVTGFPKNWVVKGTGNYDEMEPVVTYLLDTYSSPMQGETNHYYGVIENQVSHFFFKQELTQDTVILTLEEFKGLVKAKQELTKETEMKNIQRITRENLKEIVDVACDEWQRTLCEKAKEQDALSSFVEFDNEFVLKMYKAATASQKLVLDKFLKKPEAEDLIAIPKGVDFDKDIRDLSVKLFGGGLDLQRISFSATKDEYKYRAFYVRPTLEVKINSTRDGGTEIVFLKRKDRV